MNQFFSELPKHEQRDVYFLTLCSNLDGKRLNGYGQHVAGWFGVCVDEELPKDTISGKVTPHMMRLVSLQTNGPVTLVLDDQEQAKWVDVETRYVFYVFRIKFGEPNPRTAGKS